jgi:hypothetical protein
MTQTPSTKKSELPDGWVQRIFATMQGHYGSQFLKMWQTGQLLPDGQDAGVVNAMSHWRQKIAGTSAETIKNALDNLPIYPPTLPQFIAHLRASAREPNVLRIERKWTAEELAANKERVRELMSKLNLKEKHDRLAQTNHHQQKGL